MAKLFLCGGGFGKQLEDTYPVFNAVIDHTKPLLYIPLAMPEETWRCRKRHILSMNAMGGSKMN